MAPRDQDYPEREKPSWREIDQRRDGSRHVSRRERPAARPGTPQADRMRQRALQEAHKVFEGKQGTPAHQKMADALHRQYGDKKFDALAQKYRKEYGPPQDWALCFLFLNHQDPAAVEEALQRMAALYPSRSPREQQAFLSLLRNLSSTADDPGIQEIAEELLSSLRNS